MELGGLMGAFIFNDKYSLIRMANQKVLPPDAHGQTFGLAYVGQLCGFDETFTHIMRAG